MRLAGVEKIGKGWPLIILCCVAACLAVSIFYSRRFLPYSGRDLAPPKWPEVIMHLENAHIVGISGGSKLWSLRAKTVKLFRNSNLVTLSNVAEGNVYYRSIPVLKVEAGQVRYDPFSAEMIVSGWVRIRGTRGQIISSPGLIWSSSGSIIRTVGPVVFKSELGSVSASRLLLNLRTKEMKLFEVRGTVQCEGTLQTFGDDKNARN